ncbi:16S rRNA (cytidine(1402)-2'-O)-methyltransferase [Nitrosomonas sp. Nm33]|uniref:16S rRNA (cytidine(1402)-2'-O)-methyltransferase n=1 Tax=Nitrosomonas sp. Nm33 TaxID=133724 RepID=UPI0008944650|nr:16S rRNA (cytidine(1402)-2'-O)-methyltransferase [Nitrosomonas sp. Nm33]SDY05858.1 16S rRNA (cytidine1402-2'-O)-methyltransferase [Nitrosomonas sp. Nm33]
MLTKSTLYVVATPIGNLRDISLRALDVLAAVDVIAAEHIHITQRLLVHHAIHTRLITLHQHNERAATEKIITMLAAQKSVALVTDAGTPGVSDPGALLIHHVREQGYRVVPIPGANAAVCALSASGTVAPHFLFYGFLPTKPGERKRKLESLKSLTSCILIFHEAPHRLLECVTDMIAVFGEQRQITIARELTKLFETIYTSDLGNALTWLQSDENQQKGEFILLLSPAAIEDSKLITEQAEHTLHILMKNLPLKQAVQLAAEITGENKKKLYAFALSKKEALS